MTPRPLPPARSEFEPALELAREGRWKEAVEGVHLILDRAEAREPLASAAALALAEVARRASRAGEPAAAERALAEAVRLRPRFADLQYHHACALLARHQRIEARRALEAALAINPGYAAARVELALLDAREGLIGEALGQLRALSEAAPIEDRRTFDRGLRSLERADWDEADALLRRALRLDDPELQSRIDRCHELMKQGDAEGAAATLREVLPRHEGYPDLHALLGIAEMRLGHLDDAIASLARALELNPDFHDARVQMATALDAAGMNAAALEQAQMVLQIDGRHRGARAFLRLRERGRIRRRRGAAPSSRAR